VIVHQYVGNNVNPKALRHITHRNQKKLAIIIIDKNVLSLIAP
jgi:hypothetical protein